MHASAALVRAGFQSRQQDARSDHRDRHPPDRSDEQDECENSIDKISLAAKHMSEMLSGMLDLSRAGLKELNITKIELPKMIDRVSLKLNGIIEMSNAEISISSSVNYIEADPVALDTILQNLIENAIKYQVPSKPPKITISQENGNTIVVRDNGIGIEYKNVDRIFDIFTQLERQSAGLGMGLAIVKRLVDAHGGEITVKTRGTNMGTEFHLNFSN